MPSGDNRHDTLETILLDIQQKLGDVTEDQITSIEFQALKEKVNHLNEFYLAFKKQFGTVEKLKEAEDTQAAAIKAINDLHNSHEKQCTPLMKYRVGWGPWIGIAGAALAGVAALVKAFAG